MQLINLSRNFVIGLLVVLLTACGSQPSKQQSAQTTGELDAPVYVTFDFQRAAKAPYSLSDFAPNPYQAAPAPEAAVKEYQQAMRLLRTGEIDSAKQKLLVMVDAYPELSGPAYNLAVLSKQQDDLEQALKYAELAVERNRYNFDAQNLQAQILREQGHFDRAEQVYLSLIKTWSGYVLAYRNIGVLYDLYMGRTEDALVYYRQYNHLLDQPEPQVHGWIVDIERRLGVAPLGQAVESTSDVPAEEDEYNEE